MDISPETISKYKIKKVLKISIFILLFFILSLLIFEYFRITPSNVRFTNVTSSSVTVSWSSKTPVSATVIPFEGNTTFPVRLFCFFKEKFFDTRDVEKAELDSIESIEQRILDSEDGKLSTEDFEVEVTRKGRYTTHHVKVKKLEPNTQYSFLVGDSILFKKVKQSTGEDTITTTAIEEELETPSPTYGSVLNANSNSETAITDLPPVSDGIVYLNLYDKESEKRSNIFSSSLNKEGKWYIDISKAIDSEGNNFVETYSFEGVNMYYELELDAGELGRWKTMDFASALSPSQPFVINTPDTIQDIEIPGSVVKISNNVLGTFVPSAYAEEGVCAFSTYCEYQVKLSDGLYHKIVEKKEQHTCSNMVYINSTRIARKCAGAIQTPAQENAGLSCSGKPVETVGYNNNACYICQKEIQNGYYVAKWVQTSKFAAEGTKCYEVVEEEEEEEEDNENELTDNNQGSNQNLEAGDEIRSWLPVTGRNYDGTMITPGERLCTDVDGCTCIWNYNIKPGETTLNIDNNYTCKIDEEKGYISPEGDENMDENYTSYLPIITNISCLGSTLKDGDECNIDSSIAFLLGTWDSSTCSCKLNKKIEGASCFESNQLYFKNLTFWEDGKRLACIGGEMKEWQGSNLNAECKKDSYCAYSGIRERCLSSDDLTTLLYCDYTTLTWQTEKNDKSDYFKISSIPLVDTLENEQCKNAYCICHSGQDHLLNEYEWCVDKFSCAPLFNTNGVCNKSGNTCNFYEGKYHCDGPVNSSLNKPAIKLLSNSIVPKAFAQASETEEYIIDSSTGLISGIASGIYTFELDGITYMFFVDEEALGANNGKILIFIDNDNNGIYDEGTDTKVSELASKIAISTIQKEYSYKLKQGFNFVSFPFLNVTESARTALGLLEMLNTLTNGSVYSIAKFDSSWEIVGKNGDTYLSNDFQLIPGQGYVIKVIKDVEVSIQGYPIKFESDEDSAPITLFTGWNLIGVYGTKAKVYTAKTLLQDINSFEEINFTADIVNGWDQDAQSYEGFVLENTNGIESEYGFDFPINTLKSYFVRVADGKGNWQPSLAE